MAIEFFFLKPETGSDNFFSALKQQDQTPKTTLRLCVLKDKIQKVSNFLDCYDKFKELKIKLFLKPDPYKLFLCKTLFFIKGFSDNLQNVS